jgi:hypothetical protein
LRSGLAQALGMGEERTAFRVRERACQARGESAQFEGTEAHPDQASDGVAEGRQRAANLALASLPDGEMEGGFSVVSVETHA